MTFNNQINRDIEFGCSGKIPKDDCDGRMIDKLKENGFTVYEKGRFIIYTPKKTKKS